MKGGNVAGVWACSCGEAHPHGMVCPQDGLRAELERDRASARPSLHDQVMRVAVRAERTWGRETAEIPLSMHVAAAVLDFLSPLIDVRATTPAVLAPQTPTAQETDPRGDHHTDG